MNRKVLKEQLEKVLEFGENPDNVDCHRLRQEIETLDESYKSLASEEVLLKLNKYRDIYKIGNCNDVINRNSIN